LITSDLTAKLTTETAKKLNIDLIFLPPYSPHLNLIEYIWKTIKREISPFSSKNKNNYKN
jgi:transposase